MQDLGRDIENEITEISRRMLEIEILKAQKSESHESKNITRGREK